MASRSLLGEGMVVLERGQGRDVEDAGIKKRKGITWEGRRQHLDLCRPPPTPLPHPHTHLSHTTHHHLVAVYSRFIHPHGFKDLLWPEATF